MTAVYTVDTSNRPGRPLDEGGIAVTLDLLINGGLELPDPYGPGRDVFVLDGQRYRAVAWDLQAQALICWRVP
jgi:hypothetical protein